ncbi:hypothetical protein [Carnobacterium divergens]|uniref:hypothetical protein n=1 Tax=Carnobacterium divergens TaxID=2748 RepID=UPI00288CA068|nr:hypothetical protein [Carnobacterium divergens]MDT1943331.1 hypothetical protein [Carnobacterium divergens]
MFKNYTTNQVILPLDFSFQLEKNDIAFAIDQLIESIHERQYSDDVAHSKLPT